MVKQTGIFVPWIIPQQLKKKKKKWTTDASEVNLQRILMSEKKKNPKRI